MMFRTATVFVAILASVAHAGALITVDPTNPGPYFGGETFMVDVYVTADRNIQPRLLGYDFSQTDAMIHLSGPDGPDVDTTQEFVFDYGNVILSSALYAKFPNLPQPQTVFYGVGPIPGFIMSISAGVPFHVGVVTITLPPEPGTYLLDAANYSATDDSVGARIDFDFANPQTWSTAMDGEVEISGGQYDFVVVPEPATLALLGMGGIAATIPRRKSL